MTAAEAVAGVLLLAITMYACSGLADYGAGFWDLLAGGRGARATAAGADRRRRHAGLGGQPCLAYLPAHPELDRLRRGVRVDHDDAVRSAAWPCSASCCGRRASPCARTRRGPVPAHLTGWLFGIGSVLTPFFLGAALGASLSGRVPGGNAAGNELTAGGTPTSIAVGLLALLTGAFLSAVYLVAESRLRGMPDLHRYFRVRAVVRRPGRPGGGRRRSGCLAGRPAEMFDRADRA